MIPFHPLISFALISSCLTFSTLPTFSIDCPLQNSTPGGKPALSASVLYFELDKSTGNLHLPPSERERGDERESLFISPHRLLTQTDFGNLKLGDRKELFFQREEDPGREWFGEGSGRKMIKERGINQYPPQIHWLWKCKSSNWRKYHVLIHWGRGRLYFLWLDGAPTLKP